MVVANRTVARGAARAAELGGRLVPLSRVAAELAEADLVVAATAGARPTVTAGAVAGALARRAPGRPLVVLDLGVPRDVDPEVRRLPGVVLADLDGLRAVLETDEGPRLQVERVRALIAEETHAFVGGQREARLAPTIRVLRARAERARQQELAKAAPRLAGLDERERAAVEAVTRGLVNKLLHDPMVRGKALAGRPDGDLYVAALRELYGLDGDEAG
jgi:glutamyl-tRNA reductase